jgi:hypothetical protein
MSVESWKVVRPRALTGPIKGSETEPLLSTLLDTRQIVLSEHDDHAVAAVETIGPERVGRDVGDAHDGGR